MLRLVGGEGIKFCEAKLKRKNRGRREERRK